LGLFTGCEFDGSSHCKDEIIDVIESLALVISNRSVGQVLIVLSTVGFFFYLVQFFHSMGVQAEVKVLLQWFGFYSSGNTYMHT